MKLPITCNQCKTTNTNSSIYLEAIEIRDDPLYKITCPNGHESITLLTAQKHEMLFEIGAYAVVDGYYREAISSFASSLERYYEFFIKTILTAQSKATSEVEKSWKNVSNASERQLGGYIFTHLLAFGTTPPQVENSLVKLRNEVIHKGKIPSRDEAIKYGEHILSLIQEGIKKLRHHHQDAVTEMIRQSICLNDENDKKVGTLIIPTILNLIVSGDDYHSRSLVDAIREIEKNRFL